MQIKYRLLFLMLLVLSGMKLCAQRKVEVIRFKDFEPMIHPASDTTYIFNFWATWCMPCLAEWPEFEKLHQQTLGKPVKVVMVSLDDYRKLNITLIPYLDKKGYTATVVLLNEPDYNAWIDKVYKRWEGSIPATLIVNTKTKYRNFVEREVTFEELMTWVDQSSQPKE